VINALHVGGVQQIELCVTVARVARSEARSMGFSFLQSGDKHFIGSVLSSPLATVAANLPSATSVTANLASSPNITFGVLNGDDGFLGFLEC
jgi:Flp pilus assembly secretin CpaC